MKRLWKFLVGAGVLMVLLAFVSACDLPLLGFGVAEEGDETVVGGAGEEQELVTGSANTDGAETILIPDGTFWMGSEDGDSLADEDEFRRHQVTLSAYYIYTHEVTNGMYAACVAAGGCDVIEVHASGPTLHYGDALYDDFPVVGVDWNMASDYCAWANARLPTEAEWELAARGAQSLIHPWGAEAPACDRVNMLGCLVPPDTVAAGSFSLGNSPFGLWDMSGNVWEWVNDWYDEAYYYISPANDPIGPYDGELKVARGGGFKSEPVQMRAATRVGGNPYRSYDDVGFRCVVADLALPEAFETPMEAHVGVPPGGLEPCLGLECPGGPWDLMGYAIASCPFADGHMELTIFVHIPPPFDGSDVSVTVNGNPFVCVYDDVARELRCEGPLPADDAMLTFYSVEITVAGGGTSGLRADRPTDCPPPMPDLSITTSVECPLLGSATVLFTFDPAVVWDVVQLDDADIPCWSPGPTQLNCLVPERPPGDHYSFYMHGSDADGMSYAWFTTATMPADCPLDDIEVHVSPMCFREYPGVVVTYTPIGLDPPRVKFNLVPADWYSEGIGFLYCGDLPGAPGDEVEVQVGIPDVMLDPFTITVPACPGEVPETGFTTESTCYPPGTAAVSIHYWPFTAPLTSVEAAGVALTCVDLGGGWYMCPGVPGEAGTDCTVTFHLADGTSLTDVIPVADCAEEEPSEGDWRMGALGCHEDETMIFFIIDTGLDWLVPGADFIYHASDGWTSYACSVVPDHPGRLYCSGLRPVDPLVLQVCVRQTGDPDMSCQTYPDWSTWVEEMPPCSFPEEPEEPEEPVTPPFDCTAAYGASLALCSGDSRCTYDPIKKICVNP